jgi:hypothetical protein
VFRGALGGVGRSVVNHVIGLSLANIRCLSIKLVLIITWFTSEWRGQKHTKILTFRILII